MKSMQKNMYGITFGITIALLAGCATETGAGAVFGGLLVAAGAAARCKALNISADRCREQVLKGAATGAALGGLAGSRLQKRREKGEKELAFIQRNNRELAQRNRRLERENVEAKTLVANAEKRVKQLKTSVASSTEKENSFKTMNAAVEKRQAKIRSEIKDNQTELRDQNKLLAGMKGKSGYSAEAVALQKEIASLRNQISSLEQTERELASVSSTKF